MSDNQEFIVYKYGFNYNGILFCWKNKELYRMPHESGGRYYKKRLLRQQKIGNSLGYWICKDAKSMQTLKEITAEINYKEEIIHESAIPF